MTPAAPTAHAMAKRMLRDFGITSLNPASPSGQRRPIESGDLDEIAGIQTSTLQEIFDLGPAEMKQRPGSAYLHAPTAISLTATLGSTVISAVTTFASWMTGCTVRIIGDDQDNELVSSTLLARPFLGGSASGIGATVYADCVALDDTVSEILDPIFLSNGARLQMAQDRTQFRELGLYPLGGVTSIGGALIDLNTVPFYLFAKKGLTPHPFVWLVEGSFDLTLDYLPRRLRFAPMPNLAVAASWTAIHTPPRIDALCIDTGDHVTDPGVKLPIPNGWVESIFLPIARQQLTGSGLFHNEEAKAEIARSYKAAVKRLESSRGSGSGIEAVYPRTH